MKRESPPFDSHSLIYPTGTMRFARARVTDRGLFDTYSGHFFLSVFSDQWGLPLGLRVEPLVLEGVLSRILFSYPLVLSRVTMGKMG